jgi:hypothetical protein
MIGDVHCSVCGTPQTPDVRFDFDINTEKTYCPDCTPAKMGTRYRSSENEKGDQR